MPSQPLKRSLLLLLTLLHAGSAFASSSFECVIEPTQTVDIRSPIVGVLEKTNVKRGDTIHKGQVLAQLESSVEYAATKLAHYKANMTTPITTAENKIDFAKRKFQRRQEMHAENFIPAQELEEAESELILAQSELKMALENKELATLEWQHQNAQLELRTIYSPFNGVVVEQNIYPGEVVEPSGQKENILKLAQLDPLRVYVILPMSAFGKITKGMEVNISPEIPVGSQYQGKVNIIDKVVDAASGTFGVFIEMTNPKLSVPAGVKCQAEFPVGVDGGD